LFRLRTFIKHRIMRFKCLFTFLCLIYIFKTTNAQFSNIEIVGKLNYENTLSDVWGYATNNKEYALVCVQNGVSIVDVSDPTSPKEIHFVEGFFANARDIKTYKNFAYSTNGKEEGLLIIDLNELPEKVEVKKFTGIGENVFTASHNLFIDEFGFLYVAGHNISPGGILIYDLNTDFWSPELVGIYRKNYVHDLYARENMLYTSEGDQMAIIDASDKSNLKILGTQKTYGYTHNSWLSESGDVLFTTDETSGAWVVAWDISSSNDIKELGKAQSTINGKVIPHNTLWFNNYLVTSFYTDGLVIFDVANPNVLVKIAQADTAPQFSGDGFNGCWGAYPFLPSGNILATDIEEGLFVLKANYKRAALLSGMVRDSLSNDLLGNVKITIKNEDNEAFTDIDGSYIIGLANEGTYEVRFSKIGYYSEISLIDFVSGETVNFDKNLSRDENFVSTQSANSPQNTSLISLSENPFTNKIELSLKDPALLNKDIEIIFFSKYGRLLEKQKLFNNKITWGVMMPSGIYHYVINKKNWPIYFGKIVKLK